MHNKLLQDWITATLRCGWEPSRFSVFVGLMAIGGHVWTPADNHWSYHHHGWVILRPPESMHADLFSAIPSIPSSTHINRIRYCASEPMPDRDRYQRALSTLIAEQLRVPKAKFLFQGYI